MIIIEGTDTLGKTTLAKELVRRLNNILCKRGDTLWYGHMSKPPIQWDHLNGYLDHINRWTVQDRFHYGRLAYAIADPSQEEKLTSNMVRIIEGRLAQVGAVIVVITGTDSFLLRQMDSTNRDEMYDRDIIRKANDAYRDIAETNQNVDYHYEAKDIFPAENVAFVGRIIKLWLQRQALIERMRPCYQVF